MNYCTFGCSEQFNSDLELANHYLEKHPNELMACHWALRLKNSFTANKDIDPVCGKPYSMCHCDMPIYR
jgi:hypothetical protein